MSLATGTSRLIKKIAQNAKNVTKCDGLTKPEEKRPEGGSGGKPSIWPAYKNKIEKVRNGQINVRVSAFKIEFCMFVFIVF